MRSGFPVFTIVLLLLPLSVPLAAKEWDPRLLQVSRLTYRGDLKEAESILEEYRREEPGDPNGLFLQAAILEWESALQGGPSAPAHRQGLAIYQEAQRLAFRNWHRDPENVDRLIDLGNSYLFLGRKYYDVGASLRAVLTAKKCQRHLEKALRLDPSRLDGLVALGGFHYFASLAPPGLSLFRKLLGIRGTREEGIEELRRAMTGEHPFRWDAQYSLVYLYTDYEKDTEEALRLADDLIRRFPANPSLRYKRPMILEKRGPLAGAEAYRAFARWCEGAGERCHPSFLSLASFYADRLLKAASDLDKTRRKDRER